MTPPLFLVPELGSGDRVELTGDEARHAATVKRVTVGELVLLSDGRGSMARGRALHVERDRITFEVTERRTVPEPDPRFVVVQALPKGDRADLAIEILTELGVDEIVPWAASRSVSQWRGTDKVDRGISKWRRTAAEATKQSRRARIPAIGSLATTADVASRIGTAAVALVLHEDATTPLETVRLPGAAGDGAGGGVGTGGITRDVIVIVGPEGGISDAELAEFTAAGASPVKLGAEVMRTSTAGAASLAVLSVAAGRWR